MIHYLQTATSPPVLPRLNTQTLATDAANFLYKPNTQPLAGLLLGFFAHYAALPMDQALCVATASYLPWPGSVPFERFCILDPLAPDEDLGRHLTPETLPELRRELERARVELLSGTTLAEVIGGHELP